MQRPVVQLHQQHRPHGREHLPRTRDNTGLASLDVDLDHIDARQALPDNHGVERFQRHALRTRAHHIVMREIAQRVVAGVNAMRQMQVDEARLGAERRGDDLDVFEAVTAEIALQMRAFARTGLDGDHLAGRPDAAGREERVVAVVGADIDEHHPGLQHAVDEGKFVGLEGAADIEAEAVVVAERHVDRGAAVPAHRQRHCEFLLAGGLPQGAPATGEPAALVVIFLGEPPAGPRLELRHAGGQDSGIGSTDRGRPHNQPAPHIVQVIAHAGANPFPGACNADRTASRRHA